MKNYEGMFIIKPDLNKENVQKVLEAIREPILKEGGSIETSQEWGKHRLGYRVKKYEEGCYYLFHFKIDPQHTSRLKKIYMLNEDILKSMITVASSKKIVTTQKSL